MAEGRVKNTELSAIAAAIRSKNGESTGYKPAEMAQAILDIPTGITPTGTVNITQNGTTDVTQYASAAVNVPNSYAAGDEGKVVSNGELVEQTARSAAITQNGTYDTTNNNEVTVNVSGGGGIQKTLLYTLNGSDGGKWINTGVDVSNVDAFLFIAYDNGVKTKYSLLSKDQMPSSPYMTALITSPLYNVYVSGNILYVSFGAKTASTLEVKAYSTSLDLENI